ncbi:VOC family protein [Paractinoplanes ferrugineus]|uniref:Glyoxalase n=1 Tax=Paractinoplanes ferrugineus TaxID=113564 RepID=A0A919IXT1_9ACTN|nr:VOC family protein [Actinoplanes ferrugineus]GIE09897.1 glyoxalase [Actinoplanes ferrugineus]
MPVKFVGLHHVQLLIPSGGEDDARRFYAGVLGMTELEKPTVLKARGGCWFRGGGWEIHLAPVPSFEPARRAHPGVLVDGLDLLAEKLEAAGHPVEWDPHFPGHRRLYAFDAHGNRLEFLEPTD